MISQPVDGGGNGTCMFGLLIGGYDPVASGALLAALITGVVPAGQAGPRAARA